MLKPLTIIILLRNGETTIAKIIRCLEKQTHKSLISKIIVINDCSTDKSLIIINKLIAKSHYRWHFVHHTFSRGIAYCNNEAIRLVKTKYYLIMPQDVVLTNNNAFLKSLMPLLNNQKIVASYSITKYPFRLWNKNNFWLKCLFSRHLKKNFSGLGKFDCFNKKLLIKMVGYYDEKKFKSGGEDGDIYFRIIKKGLQTVSSENIVYHLHSNDPHFSLKQLVIKESQMAEANGVVLRKHGIITLPIFILMFFRPILLLSLFLPYLNIISLVLIILYSFLYTKFVYLYEFRNIRILLLPFINIYLLIISSYFSFKGWLFEKQST